jgi:tRNA1Val (adenine37-N6)-methyltransferase
MIDQRPFHFKHFSLLHHQSTMKVGTDAMLLGCWIDIDGATQILDIGTGCGILSLLLAQRSDALIDAVEIDEITANEATLNFKNSPWCRRLMCYQDDIKQFAVNTNKKYDLIISNPPFFTSDFKTKTERKNLARHTDTLDFESLIEVVKKLLQPGGRFALVLPFTEGQQFVKIAEKHNFYEMARMEIIPVVGKTCNRLNMVFSDNIAQSFEIESFTIRGLDGQFTDQYNNLLQDFYLGL